MNIYLLVLDVIKRLLDAIKSLLDLKKVGKENGAKCKQPEEKVMEAKAGKSNNSKGSKSLIAMLFLVVVGCIGVLIFFASRPAVVKEPLVEVPFVEGKLYADAKAILIRHDLQYNTFQESEDRIVVDQSHVGEHVLKGTEIKLLLATPTPVLVPTLPPKSPDTPTPPSKPLSALPSTPTLPPPHTCKYTDHFTIAKEADCVNDGVKRLYCSCGKSVDEEIYAAGHKYDNDDDAKCNVCDFVRFKLSDLVVVSAVSYQFQTINGVEREVNNGDHMIYQFYEETALPTGAVWVEDSYITKYEYVEYLFFDSIKERAGAFGLIQKYKIANFNKDIGTARFWTNLSYAKKNFNLRRSGLLEFPLDTASGNFGTYYVNPSGDGYWGKWVIQYGRYKINY